MGPFDTRPDELEARLERELPSVDPELTGPFRVLSVSREAEGLLRCEVTAYRLVPVEPADPAVRDVSVPVPVTGWVELRLDGSRAACSLPPPGGDAVREARLAARDLIERGEVRGLPGRPDARGRRHPTHEVQTDAAGRRVIRRLGFSGQGG